MYVFSSDCLNKQYNKTKQVMGALGQNLHEMIFQIKSDPEIHKS